MRDHAVNVMYDEFDHAWAARDRLLAIGIPPANVNVFGEGAAGSTSDYRQPASGFLGAIRDFFFSEEDRSAFVKGLDRGAALLSARVPESRIEAVCRILEETRPVDLDATGDEWERKGWADFDPRRPLDEQRRPADASPSTARVRVWRPR